MSLLLGKFFVSPDCPKCKMVRERVMQVLSSQGVDFIEFDVTNLEGEVEAVLYNVKSLPCLVVCERGGEEREVARYSSSFFEEWDGRRFPLPGSTLRAIHEEDRI
ncbi:MAG: glutaredoxin domain-containing protein [Candidatus Hadarchaeales archaeon]